MRSASTTLAPGSLAPTTSTRTVQQFVQHELVDEYWIKLYPVALGAGQPLHVDLKQPADLALAESRTYDSGIITLRYAPA